MSDNGRNIQGPSSSRRGVDRLGDTNADGQAVNHVTPQNRYDIDPKNPWLEVQLATENNTVNLARVWIPNRRERPDVVMCEGLPYIFWDTNLSPPVYTLCMVDTAVATPPQQENPDGNET